MKKHIALTRFNAVLTVMLFAVLGAALHGVLGSTTINRTLTSGTLNEGLIAHWTFDGEDMVGNVSDASGNGHDGTLQNQTPTTTLKGVVGQALGFDGSDDYVRVTDNSFLEPAEDFSILFWFQTSQTGNKVILEKDNNNGYSVQRYSNNKIGITVGGNQVAESSGTYNDGLWHHAAMLYDANANMGFVYIDGIDDTDSTNTGTPVFASDTLTIGSRDGAVAFEGFLDDVRIYNRALSAKEIQRLYDLGATTRVNISMNKGDIGEGLIAHWTFDGEDMVGNVSDASGNGHDGTLQNQTPTTTLKGVVGQALGFDGSDDYVRVADNAELEPSGPFSISFWGKTDTTANGVVLEKDDNNGYSLQSQFNKYKLAVGNANAQITMSTDSNDDMWHHVVFVYRGVNNGTVYLDGVDDTDVGNTDPGTAAFSTDTFTIGGRNASAPFPGSLDDIRLYNRALSETEAKRLYDLGATTRINASLNSKGSLSESLVGRWTFDGKDMVSNIADAQGMYDGTLHFGGSGNTATTTVRGVIGQALTFDGADDRVYINGAATALPSATPFAVSGWVRPHDVGRGVPWSFHASGTNRNIFFWAQDSSNARFYNYGSGYTGSTNTFATNEWHHVVWQVDSDTNGTMYVNGTEEATWGDGQTSPVNQFSLGQEWDSGTPSDFFDGDLDDVRLYSRLLSVDEVQRLYDLGR